MRQLFTTIVVFLLVAGGAAAATFEPVSYARLIGSSDLVVVGTVLDSVSREMPDGMIRTEQHLQIEDIVRGAESHTTIVIAEGGGIIGDRGVLIPGTPVYSPGSRVLAFLHRRNDGTYYTAYMALGQYRFARNRFGEDVLVRDAAGIETIDGEAFDARPARAFVDFLRDGGKGAAPRPVRSDAVLQLNPATNASPGDYAMLADGVPVRRDCTPGCTVSFTVIGNQPGISDPLSAAMTAANMWNVSGSYLQMNAGSAVPSKPGYYQDGNDDIVLSYPKPFPDQTYCPNANFGCTMLQLTAKHQFPAGGPSFWSIVSADVMISTDVAAGDFKRVLAHEIGHAVGLRHSDETNRSPNTTSALMSTVISVNSLQQWDKDAITTMYGDGPPCEPAAIGSLSAPASVNSGSTAKLSVSATGTNLTYQWFEGKPGSGTAIAGATLKSFTTPPLYADASYYVQVKGDCGTPVTSDAAIITITTCNAPEIITQPQSQQVLAGSTATLALSVNGSSPFVYQWYQSATVGDTSHPVGGNSSSFTTPALTTATSYWARVSNCATTVADSTLATITVTAQCVPPAIVSQTTAPTVKIGDGVTLGVIVSGTAPFTYQWYEGNLGDTTKPIAGATAGSWAAGPFTSAGTYHYWVQVTNGCFKASSSPIVVTVTCGPNPVPTIYAPASTHWSASYEVSWTGNFPQPSSFELQEATDKEFTTNLKTFPIHDATKLRIDAHSDVMSDTRFFYRVRTISSCSVEPSEWSDVTTTVVLRPHDSYSEDFTISVPSDMENTFTQDFLVPGFGEHATPGDVFAMSSDAPWLTIFPSAGALSAGGTTVRCTINPATLAAGSTTATLHIVRTQGSGKTASNATSMTSSIPFTVSKVTPVTPAPRSPDAPAGTLLIPAVAHADGIGTRFQSDVRLVNALKDAITYDLSFTASGADGTATAKRTTITLSGESSVGLDDVVKGWFGGGVLGEAGLGTLEIRPTGNANPLATFASSRTYAISPAGTLGQFIPAIALAKFAGNITEDPLARVSLQQIANSASYRTNLGFVEGSGAPVILAIKLLDGHGNLLKEVTKPLAAFGHEQVGFTTLFGNIPVEDGRVEVTVSSSSGKATAYASVVDNKTSDPLLVFPVQAQRVHAQHYVVPGIAELENGASNFHSDMRIYNAATSPVTVAVNYFPQTNDATPRPAPFNVTISAGEVKSIDNVLPTLFNLTRTGGAVTIDAPSDAQLVVTARTYSRDANGGTYGQFIPGVTAADGVGAGDRALEVLQLEQSEQYRTNLGLVEITGKPVEVTLIADRPGKTTVSTAFPLAANEFRQITRVFEQMGMPTAYTGRIRVLVTKGEGRVAAYGSVVDNRTIDPTYVPAQ